jgi:50S ribosomal protein L16 3-hydroxylase
MKILKPVPLLGGLSPEAFMRQHWQKKPLLIRQACAETSMLINRVALFALACQVGVESRLIVRDGSSWQLSHGPFKRRTLPRTDQPGWTLLVQGVDLHVQAAHELLAKFHFLPSARLDDVMVSWASPGGGVGPHVDSYDVFLLQLQGQRRWRIGPVQDTTLESDAPFKVLRHFVPTQEWVLDAGDMLYLPPGWGHDGVAQGECLTASIGFRAPAQQALGREVLQCLLDGVEPPETDPLYRDPHQSATLNAGRIPVELSTFALDAIERLLRQPKALACALGEVLSEPKPNVWFDQGQVLQNECGVALDRRTRMAYDDHHVFINGESFRAGGQDARVMRRLADARYLTPVQLERLTTEARDLVDQWTQAGWLRPVPS